MKKKKKHKTIWGDQQNETSYGGELAIVLFSYFLTTQAKCPPHFSRRIDVHVALN